jgi:hypothetical protein
MDSFHQVAPTHCADGNGPSASITALNETSDIRRVGATLVVAHIVGDVRIEIIVVCAAIRHGRPPGSPYATTGDDVQCSPMNHLARRIRMCW